MKHARILGALLAFVFALCALPTMAAARPARHSVSARHHVQARGHRHKKRARRHHRKHAKSSGGMEF